MGKIIGIDLGTTNSLVTVWEDGRSRLIPNSHGEYLTPSVVSFGEKGTVYVGKIARERLVTHPERTISRFKRFMGTAKRYRVAQKEYKPEELSALILRRLKEDAEHYLNEEVEEAVISVPAYFNDLARNATKNAGRLAGLKVERIINEPSAAALAYQAQRWEEDATLLIFDFGGGTLDVSLVECFDNVVEILAVSGDNHLGGSDFDRVIAEAFLRECGIRGEDLKPDLCAIVEERALRCKQELTEVEEAVLSVEIKGAVHTMSLSRLKLIQIAESLFSRMAVPVQRVFADAGRRVGEVSAVVLVGGSCKMPIVQKYLSHILGGVGVSVMNPDHMIALGVGVYAGIKERDEEIRDMLLTDICPFSLGTAVHNEADAGRDLNDVLIERNTALPASREVVLCTVSDNQKKIKVCICQGEEMYADDNLLLGEMEVLIPPAPKGKESITLRYTYDINGILVVDVRVLSTGETKQLIICNKEISLTEQELEMKIKALECLKIHPRDAEENKAILARAERLYRETTGELRETVEERAKYFRYLLKRQDSYRLQRGQKQFVQFLDYIENYLLQSSIPICSDESFEAWYAREGVSGEEKEEWQEEKMLYDGWRKDHLTS